MSDGNGLASPEIPRPVTSGGRNAENNPFDRLEPLDEKKGETTTFITETNETETPVETRDRAPSSPRKSVLERRATDETADAANKPAGGFLSRVKSLKGARRKGSGSGGERQVS